MAPLVTSAPVWAGPSPWYGGVVRTGGGTGVGTGADPGAGAGTGIGTEPDPDTPPPPRAPHALLLLGAFFVCTVAMTFPWPTRLRSHAAGDAGDALFVLWVLKWVPHAAPHGWHAMWNADIFHPSGNALAYSEAFLSVVPFHWAMSLVVGDVGAFNIVYLASWTASLWFTYRLALRFTGAWGPSVVGALAYTFATIRLIQYGHFQLLAACLIPLVLLLLLNLLADPQVHTGVFLGLTLAAVTLWASYYGILMGLTTGIVVVVHVVIARPRPIRPLLLAAGVGALVALALIGPVAWKYVQLQKDPHFQRTSESSLSAHLGDFLAVSPTNHLLADAPVIGSRSVPAARSIENRLFPGFVALGFGAVGLVLVVADRRRSRSDRRTLLLFAVAATVMVVLSFGDSLIVAGHTFPMPYRWLRNVVPGLEGIRALARFVVLAQCVLALFAAIGVAALAARFTRRAAMAIVALCAVAVLAETATGIAAIEVPTASTQGAVNTFLATRPPGVVAELPILGPAQGAAWAYVEAPRQLLSRVDGHPRVNGYSGFAPPDFDRLTQIVNSFPKPDAIRTLDDLGVRYVVLRTSIPVVLPSYHLPLVAGEVGAYGTVQARLIVARIPADRLARSAEVPGGIVVELTRPG